MSKIMNIEEIRKYVPHRYPFLMLDRIIDIDYEKNTLKAIKNVTINEPIFTGHFPEEAIFPGVMIIEALAQASGMLVYLAAMQAGTPTSNLYYLAGIDHAKFKKPVRPGDQLQLCVELMQEKQNFSIFKTKCTAKVDDVVVCSAELLCVKKEEDVININIDPTAIIDSTAVIDPTATIKENVKIGANSIIGPNVEVGSYSIIGHDVEVGEGSWIGPHVVISKLTKMGKNNKVYQFASLGEDPQDLHFAGEVSRLEIGDNNIFRESVTISRGTAKQDLLTKIGSDNLFMAYSHVAHDCTIGDHAIFANGATLAGHIVVEDYVTISAFCAVHQFCNIGAYSFLTYAAMVNKDVLPYLMIAGNDPKTYGLNKVGLERRGFSKETINMLQTAYKIIFKKGLTIENAKIELHELVKECPEVQLLLDGLDRAKRGIIR